MHRYTAKIIIRNDAIQKNGKVSLALQCFINGSRKVIGLNISVLPEHFNAIRQEVQVPEEPEYSNLINANIRQAKIRAEKIFMEAMLANRPLDRPQFTSSFLMRSQGGSFLDFMEREIELERRVKAPGTIKNYIKTINKVRDFNSGISFSSLNYNLIQRFHRYLTLLELETNTIAGYHKNFKKFINIAKLKGLVDDNPYENFKIQKARTDREFLEADELQLLIDMYRRRILSDDRNRILRYFLFMCFTSMRYDDVRNLTVEKLKGDYMSFRPGKTKKTMKNLKIDFNHLARELISDSLKDPLKIENEKVFDCSSLQKSNSMLKKIAAEAGIGKNLTCHVGRHTFATTFLSAGGTVDVLKDIMGHSNLETTMVYVHIADARRKEMMESMADLFKF